VPPQLSHEIGGATPVIRATDNRAVA